MTVTYNDIHMTACKILLLRDFSFFFSSPPFWVIKNSPQPPPCVSLLCVSNAENWHAVNGEIFKGRPGLPVSHWGLLFTPSPLPRNQNSVDVTQADWSLVSGALPMMAGFIKAVSQALVMGQSCKAPSGPNQCWGPQERAIKQPNKTTL